MILFTELAPLKAVLYRELVKIILKCDSALI